MPCLTEAMHLLHRLGGYPAQEALWQLIDSGWLVLHQSGEHIQLSVCVLGADTPQNGQHVFLLAQLFVFSVRTKNLLKLRTARDERRVTPGPLRIGGEAFLGFG